MVSPAGVEPAASSSRTRRALRCATARSVLRRHSRGRRESSAVRRHWIPACAGMTILWRSRPELNRHSRLERPLSSPLDDGNEWGSQRASNSRLDAGNVALFPLSYACPVCYIPSCKRTIRLFRSHCRGGAEAFPLPQKNLVPHPGFEPGISCF